MKNIIKLGLILAAFTTISCTALSVVYIMTKPVIEKHAAEKLAENLRVVYPDAEEFRDITDEFPDSVNGTTFTTVYLAEISGIPEGIVIEAQGPTYDKSTVLTALTKEGIILNMRVTSTSDTVSLGGKAMNPEFYTQFSGMSASSSFTAGKGIVAISGATITTNGIGAIVKDSCNEGMKYLSALKAEEPQEILQTEPGEEEIPPSPEEIPEETAVIPGQETSIQAETGR